MKVGFFLLKFPLSSETFVLNQITAFIDMGFEGGDCRAAKRRHTKHPRGNGQNITLAARTRWFTGRATRQSGETAPPRQPDVASVFNRKNTWQALNLKRYRC